MEISNEMSFMKNDETVGKDLMFWFVLWQGKQGKQMNVRVFECNAV